MRIWLIIMAVGLAQSAYAQGGGLELDPDFDAERLVKEVFASGNCETIFNVRQIGSNPDGIGFFSGPTDIVGFDRGIILSTGKVTDAAGPNDDTTVGTELSGPTDDPDLSLASSGKVFDRSGVEFDFVPLQPTVTFRYVFASEEYCEFVGAAFNDIFGFFISGPGINGRFADGAINLATIPGTNQPVTINNINFDSNPTLYLDNEFPAVRMAAGCGGGSEPGPRFQKIEYDGQTVILTATVTLQTCATYHIRLLVGDVQDSDLDSAVFLEAGSFDIGGSVTFENNGPDTSQLVVYEGCAASSFRITRGADSNPENEQVIAYRVGSGSVAREGVDFTSGSGTVTIAAGEDFAEIPIVALADNTTEGPEPVWLVLDIPCACYTDSIRIVIDEPEPLVVGLEEAFYCPGEVATLSPELTGGVPPFEFEWSFGSREAEPRLMPPLPSSISLLVTDACGQSVRREIGTFSSEPPGISFPAQELVSCWDEEQQIIADLTGNGPFDVTYQLNGGDVETVTFPNSGRRAWPIDRGGNYRIIAIEDKACKIAVDEMLRADFYRPVINARLNSPSCAGANDGSIEITHLQTVEPYIYRWTGVQPEGLRATGLSAGTYNLQVIDALGCTDERELVLEAPDPLLPIEVTCSQSQRPPLRLSASGGRPPYEYSIDGINFFGVEGLDLLEPGSYYDLRIRDVVGCEILQRDFFYPKAAPRSARLPNFIPQEPAGSVEVFPDYLVPLDQIAGYRWYPAELFDCPTCPNPVLSAPSTQPISLAIDNIYGCTDSLVTFVAVDGRVPLYVPTVFSPNGDGTNDYIAVFANTTQVERIVSFRVFTRWGEMVWEDFDFAPNSARRGWDGLIDGKPAHVGAYVWVAEIRLLSGEIQRDGGTTILLGD